MIVVNLMTTTNGEIKKFLDIYYSENTKLDSDVMEWIYVYHDTEEAIKIIQFFMNKANRYSISLWVQINDGDLTPVKKGNYTSVINQIEENI